MDATLLDHRHEHLLGRAVRLQEAGKIASLLQFWDLQRDPTGPGIPVPVAAIVALNLAQGRTHALCGAGSLFDRFRRKLCLMLE